MKGIGNGEVPLLRSVVLLQKSRKRCSVELQAKWKENPVHEI